jgi:hypothetical protein
MKNPTNRRSLNLINSCISLVVLETEDPKVRGRGVEGGSRRGRKGKEGRKLWYGRIDWW